jgi:type 1 glutamine amidotransferase
MRLLLALALTTTLAAQFRWRDAGPASVELTDNGAPVFTYNFGTMLKDGVPADRARCCYVHPVYAPNGVILTDDFPKDHYHHRGIHWMWPVVTVDGKSYDLWLIKGIHARFEKWQRKEATAGGAVIAVRNGWYIGDRKIVDEQVEIVAHPVERGSRELEFTLRFRAAVPGVTIAGMQDGKGYGGFNIRFAPRASTILDAAEKRDVPDSDLRPNAWAELSGIFDGKPAAARITIDPSTPGYPNGWCLRHYGYLGANYPGLKPVALSTDRDMVMKYRVSLIGTARPATSKVLVYTRNFVTGGGGYVHDNIPAAVEAIRKLGAANGFSVDSSDDPAVFTDANLRNYRALVFASSNNEAFANDAQRDAFRRYIQGGGGFAGIHSATGSERSWPWYWSTIGGKFKRHPKIQPFTVAVKDASHPSTRSLPASFQWDDECYFHEYLNPDLKPLLETDPTALDDPGRAAAPATLFGKSMPLAWTITTNGSRVFYTALGHKKEHYSNPLLLDHILGGILWAMRGKE